MILQNNWIEYIKFTYDRTSKIKMSLSCPCLYRKINSYSFLINIIQTAGLKIGLKTKTD